MGTPHASKPARSIPRAAWIAACSLALIILDLGTAAKTKAVSTDYLEAVISKDSVQTSLTATPMSPLATQAAPPGQTVVLFNRERWVDGPIHPLSRECEIKLESCIDTGMTITVWGNNQIIDEHREQAVRALLRDGLLTEQQAATLATQNFWHEKTPLIGGWIRTGVLGVLIVSLLGSTTWILTRILGVLVLSAIRRSHGDVCTGCSYDLADIRPDDSGRRICPECGRATDLPRFRVQSSSAHGYGEPPPDHPAA